LARFAGLAGSAAATAEIVMRRSVVATAAERPASLNYHFRLHQTGERERERGREGGREGNLLQLVAARLYSAGFSAPGKPNRLRVGTLRIDINAAALLVD